MKRKIKYFCYYHYLEGKYPRECVLAASTKIDYIVEVLNSMGYEVELISKTGVSTDGFSFDLGKKTKLGNNSIRHFASFGCKKSFLRVASRWLNNIHFFLWLLFNVKRGETIIVYHGLAYCQQLNSLRKLKGVKIIGEIEELYQDVHKKRSYLAKAELKFIENCSAYIFPTVLMDNRFNPGKKPVAIVHGVYKPADNVAPKFEDGRIHVVYGGTFDPVKGGAHAAATVGRFLPENYVIHICGFGNKKDTDAVKKLVKEVNKYSKSQTIFEGLLQGDYYTSFIQKCHIGLSTQNPSASFNDTSFPSKILVYLSNGLDVVSIRIPVVETCCVVDAIHFYENQTPECIATAIMKFAGTSVDKKVLLTRANDIFSQSLTLLLNSEL